MYLKRKFKKVLISRWLTSRVLSDRAFYWYSYLVMFGKPMSYKNPTGLNAKIQWLKVYYRNPRLTELADKYLVRNFVKEKIGEAYLIPCIGVYEDVKQIEWDSLPDKFVLKATHASGWNINCTSKAELDRKASVRKINKWLNNKFSQIANEWQYQSIKPRMICEEHLYEKGCSILELDIFCYHGNPKFIIAYNYRSPERTIYTKDWELVEGETAYSVGESISKPEKLKQVLAQASLLSKEFPFVRVDFIMKNEKIYFGEMTFTPARGFLWFNPPKLDLLFGEPLKVP